VNAERTLVLLEAITDIREEYIDEAERCPRRVVTLPRIAGLAAACFVLFFGGLFVLAKLGVAPMGHYGAGGGSSESGRYMYYAGPVLPLTALEDEGLRAERRVTLDFGSYEEAPLSSGRRKITVTDEYLLTNPTEEDRSFTLYYPFVMDRAAETDPAVTVGGALAETELIVGPFTTRAGRLPRLKDWEDYKSWLEDGYLRRALEDPPSLDIPIVVYELRDRWGERSEEVKNPTLNMEFTIDRAKTAVITYGFNGGTNDPATGACQRHTSVPRKGTRGDGQSVYLLVLGEDIGEYALRAYTDGSCSEPTDRAGCTLVRYTSTLEEMVQLIHLQSQDLEEAVSAGLPPETAEEIRTSTRARDLIAAHWGQIGLLEGDYARFWQSQTFDGSMEDAFGHLQDERVLYLRFTVFIPAGESCRVAVTSEKHASYDFTGSRKDLNRNGYDLTTVLGSPLDFTRQEAALAGAEHITILDQNFGFDPEKGILQVTLDPMEEHYFMDVEAKRQN
jgi:hypothetical protein